MNQDDVDELELFTTHEDEIRKLRVKYKEGMVIVGKIHKKLEDAEISRKETKSLVGSLAENVSMLSMGFENHIKDEMTEQRWIKKIVGWGLTGLIGVGGWLLLQVYSFSQTQAVVVSTQALQTVTLKELSDSINKNADAQQKVNRELIEMIMRKK